MYGKRLTLGLIIGSVTGAAGALVPMLTDVYKAGSWKPASGPMGWREVMRAGGCFGAFFATFQARNFLPLPSVCMCAIFCHCYQAAYQPACAIYTITATARLPTSWLMICVASTTYGAAPSPSRPRLAHGTNILYLNVIVHADCLLPDTTFTLIGNSSPAKRHAGQAGESYLCANISIHFVSLRGNYVYCMLSRICIMCVCVCVCACNIISGVSIQTVLGSSI